MEIFIGFPKISRLSREIIISEKIDGTNGCIFIGENNLGKILMRVREEVEYP